MSWLRALRTRWLLLALPVAVVLAAVVLVLVVGGQAQPAASPQDENARLCAQTTQLNQQRQDAAQAVTLGTRTAVVLGDSYAQGLGLPDPRTSWPTPVGQAQHLTMWVDAVGATGFVNGGFCKGQAFPDRLATVLARRPALVIVQGGLNDATYPQGRVIDGVDRVLAGLGSVPRVVVVGPVAVPTVPADRMAAVDATIRGETLKAHREYVSALAWRFPTLSDHIHPTGAGQAIFARDVLAALGPVTR